jgi:hypothetical protein
MRLKKSVILLIEELVEEHDYMVLDLDEEVEEYKGTRQNPNQPSPYLYALDDITTFKLSFFGLVCCKRCK